MKNLKAKLNKQGGFTLVEMLIVVALIAILIAISIPAMSQSLEKAKEATDKANERSAMSLAIVKLSTADSTEMAALKGADKAWYYKVDNTQGSLEKGTPGTGATGADYGQSKGRVGAYITITYAITADKNTITLAWGGDATETNSLIYSAPVEV